MTINATVHSLDRLLELARDKLVMPEISHEARIDIARAALEAWHKPCPFRPKDIVVPAQHSTSWKRSLGPSIVSEVYREPTERFDEKSRRFVSSDMRVICADEQGIVAELEAHSRDFELWTPAASTQAKEQA